MADAEEDTPMREVDSDDETSEVDFVSDLLCDSFGGIAGIYFF